MGDGRRDFQASLERFAGCNKRRPPPDLSWLFSEVAKAANDHLSSQEHHKEDGSSPSLFQVLPSGAEGVPHIELQSYRQWKWFMREQRLSHPLRLRRHTITLQPLTSPPLPGYPITEVDPLVLKQLRKFCAAFFLGMTVELAPPINLNSIPNLTSRVHPATNRRQYLVGDILKYLARQRPSHAQCMIAMTTVDLYPSPDLNFVLGHAQMHTGCGVFGFGRHFSSQFSSSSSTPTANQQLGQLWVLTRVVSHELCHTLGMKHCYHYHCAMNESVSIQQAATQPLFLCPICLRKLKKWVNFDIFQRYLQLKEVISELVEVSLSLEDDNIRNSVTVRADRRDYQESGKDNCHTSAGDTHQIPAAAAPIASEPAGANLGSLPQGFQLERLQEASQWLDKVLESTHTHTL